MLLYIPIRHVFVCFVGFCSIVLMICFYIGYSFFTSVWNTLPDIHDISKVRLSKVTHVYARDGSLMGTLYKEKRYPISLNKIPKHVLLCFLAAEDSSFYDHLGIDFSSIIRAFIANLKNGEVKEGASTITQQVIKRFLLSSEKTYERKLKEAMLAIQLERILSKDAILELYLNEIYFGEKSYGIEAAARTYFFCHTQELTLAQAALLAGLPKAPSANNPFKNPGKAVSRQRYVLKRLVSLGWISEKEYETACLEELQYAQRNEEECSESIKWYLEETRRLLIEFLTPENLKALGIESDISGEEFILRAGLTVRTSMDPRHQEAAGRALRDGLVQLEKIHGWSGNVIPLTKREREDFYSENNKSPAIGQFAEAIVTKISSEGMHIAFSKTEEGLIPAKKISWIRFLDREAEENAKIPSVNDLVLIKHEPDGYMLWQEKPIQGAIASIEIGTGDVVALIGGYRFGDSHFNRATQARRQPGSSFKPIVYSAALDNGYTPLTSVLDGPLTYVNPYSGKVWRPSNFEGNYKGWLPLHTALALSRNTCSVRLAQRIGIDTVIERAKIMGFEPDFPEELSISLGAVAVSPLNMAQAYAVFANGGVGIKPVIIRSIADSNGKIIYEQKKETWRAISPENAYIMSHMLTEVVEKGTGVRAKVPGYTIAGKTGTTNKSRDAWFVGFSPSLVTSVYIGRDNMKPMNKNMQGGRTAAPIFAQYRKEVEPLYPKIEFEQPESIVFENNQPLSQEMVEDLEEQKKSWEEGVELRDDIDINEKEDLEENLDEN